MSANGNAQFREDELVTRRMKVSRSLAATEPDTRMSPLSGWVTAVKSEIRVESFSGAFSLISVLRLDGRTDSLRYGDLSLLHSETAE